MCTSYFFLLLYVCSKAISNTLNKLKSHQSLIQSSKQIVPFVLIGVSMECWLTEKWNMFAILLSIFNHSVFIAKLATSKGHECLLLEK